MLTLAQLCRRKMFVQLCLNCARAYFPLACPEIVPQETLPLYDPAVPESLQFRAPTVALCTDCTQLDYQVTKTFVRSSEITVDYFEENRILNSISAGYDLRPEGASFYENLAFLVFRSIVLEYVALLR